MPIKRNEYFWNMNNEYIKPKTFGMYNLDVK